jgi:hypothetical protein
VDEYVGDDGQIVGIIGHAAHGRSGVTERA